MKQGWFLAGVVLLLVPLLLAGCGVAQDEHDAVIAERDVLQSELDAAQETIAELTAAAEAEAAEETGITRSEELMIGCNTLMKNKHFRIQSDISVDGVLTVVLCSNPGTGFQWSEFAEIADATILEQLDHEYEPPEGDVVGGAGKETWTFKALSKGVTTISMEYSRARDAEAEWTFKLTVIVK